MRSSIPSYKYLMICIVLTRIISENWACLPAFCLCLQWVCVGYVELRDT